MRLTGFTDFALRTLIYLAVRPDRLCTIADVAGDFGISDSHLTKVVHHLARTGEIETVRGHGGGMRLARAARSINVGSVVRQAEPDMELAACFDQGKSCAIAPACILRGALAEALCAFLAVLDRYTLADLVADRSGLETLLGIDQPRAEAIA